MGAQQIIFGWGAEPMQQQFPQLSAADAAHFDKDNVAIIRLHVRGLLTDKERDAAIKRATKRIEATLGKAPA